MEVVASPVPGARLVSEWFRSLRLTHSEEAHNVLREQGVVQVQLQLVGPRLLPALLERQLRQQGHSTTRQLQRPA